MKHKHLAFTLGAVITSTMILLFSCRKINESTSLGDELIPPIDNINTFDTTLEIEAYNDTFSLVTDSTRYSDSYQQVVGHIENDPIFGKTDAQLYLQLKPSFFKFSFLNKPDSLHIDSVVLVLNYVDTYGDSTVDQTFDVYEVAQSGDFRYDTAYLIRDNPIAKAGLLGSRTFKPSTLNDTVNAYKDTTANQLRIRLDDSFGQRLLNYDTTAGPNGAFVSDSIFNTKFKGFAIESTSGNALIGIDLAGANTKLAIYYKDDNNDKPIAQWDTAVSYFTFAGNARAASAQFIKRDYSGTAVETAAASPAPADLVYIQNTPGTFAKIKIPGLGNMPNAIVHRAELIMEQVYDMSDSTFPQPLLYVDAYDPTVTRFKTVPYDFLFDANGGNNLGAYGAAPYNASDGLGHNVKVWRFNLTRYVQHVLNDTEVPYDLRLLAPVYTTNFYKPGPTLAGDNVFVSVNPVAGKGRVRLHGGDLSKTNPKRMRLRVVYSKI